MKRVLLMFMSGLLAGAVNGQIAHSPLVFNNAVAPNATLSPDQKAASANRSAVPVSTSRTASPTQLASHHATAAHRGTLGGDRWYDYVDEVLRRNFSVVDVAAAGLDLWNDTSSIMGYTGVTSGSPYQNQEFTSVGMSFHPFASIWNDATLFATTNIAVSSSDAYTIDSVQVGSWYNRNYTTSAKMAVVD